MLGLNLRDEFRGAHMPGTAISLRTSDNKGAAQKSPDYILSITYPTADVLASLKAINAKRSGRPIVLLGERGRGKSHLMAVMHHAIQSPELVDSWLHSWGDKLDNQEMKSFEMQKGFHPISEPVHNHEYPLLWELLFDRHPKGEFYRGQFAQLNQSYPPRNLLEKMFEAQPTALILDEFQTWFTGLPEKDPKTGYLLRQWAFNFVQNLSEIAKDRPEILILVISVLNNQNEAFQQVHRQGPALIDFRGPTAKQDRQRLVLHRLFENRDHILETDIQSVAGEYANERFRLLHADKSEAERDRIKREVYACWPFSPELVELLEDHILLSQAAQETRDLIRILAQVYRSRGDKTPIVTPADFFVDGDTDEVQSLVDSVAVQAGQEQLRQIAQRNLEAVRDAGVSVPNARELVSSIWIRSLSPGKISGGAPPELHLDITRQSPIDDNAFQAELALLIENSFNIHGDEIPGGPLRFALTENPRSKVRACAKNDKLWQLGATPPASGQTVYPGKDVEHLRNTLRHIFVPETQQSPSRVIILGFNWDHDPWIEVDELDKPAKWDRPVLLAIPEQIEGGIAAINSRLGCWLAKHVQKRRNTVRFLLLAVDAHSIFSDRSLTYEARCSFLCSPDAWGSDATYRGLHKDFDRPLRQDLKGRFARFAVLKKWDFQSPQNCVFDVEKLSVQGSDIPSEVEKKILSELFDQTEFRTFVLQRAKDGDFVGALMDDLYEPPLPGVRNTMPFPGETKTYECLLQMAARGDVALNVGGAWISRRSEDTTDEDALRYVKSKAFRSGQEMRQVQMGLPGVVGGGAITAPGASTTIIPPASGKPSVTPNQPKAADAPQVTGGAGDVTIPATSTPLTAPVVHACMQHVDEPASGINLSGCFEKWNISPTQSIDSAKIVFEGLTAQQIKQILQRIPSTFKATMEVSYKEEYGQ